MQFLITFLEGIVSFLSPCMLPLLPVYLTYIAGNASRKYDRIIRTIFFAIGFSFVFVALGLLSGTLGELLGTYRLAVRIICGAAVFIMGLSEFGFLSPQIHLPQWIHLRTEKSRGLGSALILGVVYSIISTPCIGTFLGAAMAMAATSGSKGTGAVLLLCYALGLGIPFFFTAVLTDLFFQAFAVIKRHYAVITRGCGCFLMLVGVLMATGCFEGVMRSLL